MPNTREKLIELLEDRRFEASEVCGSMNKGFGAWYADHLIANGVTIQKWIPVTERLPEEMEWVMCACIDNSVHILRYDFIMDDWDIHHKPNACYHKSYVTHWMPLPVPPKGE